MNDISKGQQPLSLKKNSMWNAFGNIFYAFSQWGILMIIAKLGNPDMVGIFTLGLALTAPPLLLMRFNLRVAVVSDRTNEFSFNEYFSSRFLSTCVFLLIMSIITYIYSDDYKIALVILILSIAKAVESIGDILQGQLQKHERMDLSSKSLIGKGLLSFLLFFFIMYFTRSLILSTLGFLISFVVVLVFYDFKIVKKFCKVELKFNFKNQIKLIKLTIPLGIAQLIASLNINVPRYFIENIHGINTLGIFAALFYIITAGNNIVMGMSGAVLPRLSIYFQEGKLKEYIKLISGFSLLILIGGIIALVVVNQLGEEILVILYTTEYIDYKSEFFLLMVVGIIMYVNKVLETGLTSTRRFKIQPYINAFVLVIVFILSYIWIPSYGIVGAGYAILLAEIVLFIIRGTVLLIFLYTKKNNISDMKRSVN